jgi:hypothetical protein
MGRRFVLEREKKAGVRWNKMWVGAHQGRYWKRQLSKARRRAWKQNRVEGRLVNIYESYCNYKGW